MQRVKTVGVSEKWFVRNMERCRFVGEYESSKVEWELVEGEDGGCNGKVGGLKIVGVESSESSQSGRLRWVRVAIKREIVFSVLPASTADGRPGHERGRFGQRNRCG